MIKAKIMFSGFAILASILMLSTACIAAPVQQNVSMGAVEYSEQELINSFSTMFAKMKNDLYLKSLIEKLLSDTTLISIASSFEKTNDINEKAALLDSYTNILQNKKEYITLKTYLKCSYSVYLQKIGVQVNKFISNNQYACGVLWHAGDGPLYFLIDLFYFISLGSWALFWLTGSWFFVWIEVVSCAIFMILVFIATIIEESYIDLSSISNPVSTTTSRLLSSTTLASGFSLASN